MPIAQSIARQRVTRKAGNQVQPIFDSELLVRRKRRALAAAVPGASFLLDRAAEDLGERLATVERRFDTCGGAVLD